MYGLMKSHVCSHHTEEARCRRLHYCGTCKTIGRLYGQKSRLLLNNDAVFLAELLTALSTERQPLTDWSRAYQSYNCFALPASDVEMPLPLQIAAAITLVMTEFKVADQIADTKRSGWKLVRKLFSQDFIAAAERMKAWGFPMDELWRWGGIQDRREAEACAQTGKIAAMALIDFLAEPTATVTGLVFQHAAATIGSDVTAQQTMYEIGSAFGSLVYVLDAYEDYARDVRRSDFNALQAAFEIQTTHLPECYREATHAHIHALRVRIETRLQALPLPPGQAAKFTTRLRSNLAQRLGKTSKGSTCALPAPLRPSLRQRWKPALSLARMLSVRHRKQQPASIISYLTLPFVFGCVLAVALAFPRQALAATSFPECRDLALNLILLTAAAKALLAAPARLVAAPTYAGLASPGIVRRSVDSTDSSTGSSDDSTDASKQSDSSQKVRRRSRCYDGCGDGCCDVECCECLQGGCDCCGSGTGDCCCTGCACDSCSCS